jgi:hypothetical protein
MKVEIFTIADAATVHAGKLNILGTFDAIWAQQTPCLHPACAVAIKLRFEVTELGHHPMRLSFVNEDGKILNSIDGAFDVQFQEGNEYYTMPLAIGIQALPLPTFGDYEMRLVMDNQEVATTSLSVRQAPQQVLPA